MEIVCPYCQGSCEVECDVALGQHILCPYCEKKFSYGEHLSAEIGFPQKGSMDKKRRIRQVGMLLAGIVTVAGVGCLAMCPFVGDVCAILGFLLLLVGLSGITIFALLFRCPAKASRGLLSKMEDAIKKKIDDMSQNRPQKRIPGGSHSETVKKGGPQKLVLSKKEKENLCSAIGCVTVVVLLILLFKGCCWYMDSCAKEEEKRNQQEARRLSELVDPKIQRLAMKYFGHKMYEWAPNDTDIVFSGENPFRNICRDDEVERWRVSSHGCGGIKTLHASVNFQKRVSDTTISSFRNSQLVREVASILGVEPEFANFIIPPDPTKIGAEDIATFKIGEKIKKYHYNMTEWKLTDPYIESRSIVKIHFYGIKWLDGREYLCRFGTLPEDHESWELEIESDYESPPAQ